MVRINRARGTVSQFSYSYKRKVERKEGLLETLGFITWDKVAYEESKRSKYAVGTVNVYRINHEIMPYFTEQMTLESSPCTPLKESASCECLTVSAESSIDDLRVCSVGVSEKAEERSVKEKNVGIEEREERDSIDNTHTNRLGETNKVRRLES